MDEVKWVDDNMIKCILLHLGNEINLLIDKVNKDYNVNNKRQVSFILQHVFKKIVNDSRTEKHKKLAKEYSNYFSKMMDEFAEDLLDFTIETMEDLDEEDEIDKRSEAFFNDQ